MYKDRFFINVNYIRNPKNIYPDYLLNVFDWRLRINDDVENLAYGLGDCCNVRAHKRLVSKFLIINLIDSLGSMTYRCGSSRNVRRKFINRLEARDWMCGATDSPVGFSFVEVCDELNISSDALLDFYEYVWSRKFGKKRTHILKSALKDFFGSRI